MNLVKAFCRFAWLRKEALNTLHFYVLKKRQPVVRQPIVEKHKIVQYFR